MNDLTLTTWTADWMWSLPLIVVTVLFHTLGLGLINGRVISFLSKVDKNRVSHRVSMLVMGTTVLSATVLHWFEGLIWASAFRLNGALPGLKLAMLYSLSAMTAYGHEGVYLAPHWQLMGAVEALNGLILFGLTTAFLFTVIQKVLPQAT